MENDVDISKPMQCLRSLHGQLRGDKRRVLHRHINSSSVDVMDTTATLSANEGHSTGDRLGHFFQLPDV